MQTNLVKSYWAALFSDNQIMVKIYHGSKSRFSIESACKNKMIKTVLFSYVARSREEAFAIAKSILLKKKKQ